MPSVPRSLRWLALGTALLIGCTPTCERTCRQVLECGLDSERVSVDECILSCERQQELYAAWGDGEKSAAFDDHKSCLVDSTCEEIDAGVCYDPEIFIF